VPSVGSPAFFDRVAAAPGRDPRTEAEGNGDSVKCHLGERRARHRNSRGGSRGDPPKRPYGAPMPRQSPFACRANHEAPDTLPVFHSFFLAFADQIEG
jgi:hypothetical protein